MFENFHSKVKKEKVSTSLKDTLIICVFKKEFLNVCSSLLECEISSPLWVRVPKASLKHDFFVVVVFSISCVCFCYISIFLSADFQLF